MEHALIYLATGLAFGQGYAERAWTAAAGLVLFSGLVELVQTFVPGRHARVSDFVIDAAASCLGIALTWAVAQARESRLKAE
jgi:VanZ family protein